MTAIGERVPASSRGSLARHATSTAAAALAAALALGVPGWAAAQEAEPELAPEETAPEEVTPEEEEDIAPEMLAPEEEEVMPEMITPEEEEAAEEMIMEEEEVAPEMLAPEDETGALAPVPAPVAQERTKIGGALAAGGGVSDFTRSTARDFVDTGGSWELRTVFGTRTWLGLEAAYIGAAYGIQAPGDSTTLFSNGAELSGRLNLMRNSMDGREVGFQPYALAGAAWKNYQLSGDLATADVQDADNAFEIPVGAGLAYYFRGGVMFDVRFAYRFAFEDELIQPVGGDEASLDNWNTTARLGVEF